MSAVLQNHVDGAFVDAQHRNTGQLRRMIAGEEVGSGADSLRFFAGAARALGGMAADGSTGRS